ncbi:MAG: 50S ribosomal protein L16 [Nitrospirae bacterium]|nr:50S ribosomal protein L16 [Nitrospirota bacterium]
MLQPSRTKYRYYHRAKARGIAKGGTDLSFGAYGLKALEGGWVSDRQIEAGRVALIREVGKTGKLWIRVFPDMPRTKKPLETRMGKGKGGIEGWYACVKRGRILFEIEGLAPDAAAAAMRLAASKLPVKTRLVTRTDQL